MRVLAAMSGGVDSAVAAARAVDAGHEVVGVHLALARSPASLRTGARGCCTIEDARDARRAADVLGIPFYVWDLAERFERDVVEDFVAEYAAGRTPNPCVRCNERIKFAALLDRALALDFDAVCTGHYARTRTDGRSCTGRWTRPRTSPTCWRCWRRERLAHALFPLGDTSLKDDVRAEAAARGLQVAAKPDSHDICFIADGDTQAWLGERLGRRPGPVVDTAGAVVGSHDGAYAYTVGQRRGLALGSPAAGRPAAVRARRLAGDEHGDRRAAGRAAGPWSWSRPARPGAAPRLPWGSPVSVQMRAHGEAVPGTVTALEGAELAVRLATPVSGVAPGQTLALYDGTRVVGAATITSTC